MNEELLIIFIKNPRLGKVKTRLAATIGDDKALKVYNILLGYTLGIIRSSGCDKAVYYSDFIDEADEWKGNGFRKYVQKGSDLGERMENAFNTGFAEGYTRICIIGSDCFELGGNHIQAAFEALKTKDVVLGPTFDGGYYLLGLQKMKNKLFYNKSWSSPTVFQNTLSEVNEMNLNYAILEKLNDIDEEKDLPEDWNLK